jgi:hypothetical protein
MLMTLLAAAAWHDIAIAEHYLANFVRQAPHNTATEPAHIAKGVRQVTIQ